MKSEIRDNKEYFIKDGVVVKIRSINNEPTRTDQTQKDQCDIKNIMRQYNNNMNAIPASMRGMYGDFSDLPSYQQSLQLVMDASKAFDALPSQVRKKFSNDPAEMIKFLEDPSNNEEAIKLGLKIKPIYKQEDSQTANSTTNANTEKPSKKNTKTDSDQ